MMKFACALLLSAAALIAVSEAFAPKVNNPLNTAVRSSARVQVAATPKMEVWSEKNIRFSILAGVGLPILGIITPPDNALAASVLPLAIAGVWIYIFVDLLKAAAPSSD